VGLYANLCDYGTTLWVIAPNQVDATTWLLPVLSDNNEQNVAGNVDEAKTGVNEKANKRDDVAIYAKTRVC